MIYFLAKSLYHVRMLIYFSKYNTNVSRISFSTPQLKFYLKLSQNKELLQIYVQQALENELLELLNDRLFTY